MPPPLVGYEDPEGLFSLRIPEGWFTKRCVVFLVCLGVFVWGVCGRGMEGMFFSLSH